MAALVLILRVRAPLGGETRYNRRMALSKNGIAIPGPVVCVVMDGVGLGRKDDGDAVHLAHTPVLDHLSARAPFVSLLAHGTAVGLPSDEDMGNSEVGHNTLGAGRVFDQGAKLVNAAIESGRIWEGPWRDCVARVKASNAALHFIGLLSDGNVHSHINHLFAMLDQAAKEDVREVRVHALLDGRDVPETSALEYVDRLEQKLRELSTGKRRYLVASGGGRMKVTMDRYEADWAMVQRGWQLHVRGEGRGFPSLRAAIETLRDEDPGVTDQNLPGFVISEASKPVGPIKDGSAVILFNFRGDRAIELSAAFEDGTFTAFDRGKRPEVTYAGMMQYDGDRKLPGRFLVAPPAIDGTMSQLLAAEGITQLAISETQKFGHVTYFWNGNKSEKLPGETWIEIPSDTLPFEERPWMKAAEITDRLITELQTGKHRFARVNYANGDMVGHTGVLDAARVAVEAVDLSLGRLIRAVVALEGVLLVTADHGNADEMVERDKRSGALLRGKDGTFTPKTSHSLNRVPCYLVGANTLGFRDSNAPGLANVAATLLGLLGFEAPVGYRPSLLR